MHKQTIYANFLSFYYFIVDYFGSDLIIFEYWISMQWWLSSSSTNVNNRPSDRRVDYKKPD